MSERDDDRIAPTAHYTAYVWKHIGMPYADLFATQRGALMFWGFRLAGEGLASLLPGVPTMAQYLALRHRLIEGALEDARPDLVIELGAGLSRRGTTWAADHKVRYIEVDLPDQSRVKEKLLAERGGPALRARLGGRLAIEGADVLASDFGDKLARWLSGAERPVVVAEGLLGYFAMEDRRRLARTLARALAGRGGAFVFEARVDSGDRALGAAVGLLKGGIRLVTRGRGTREDFASVEQARSLFEEEGFASIEELPPSRVPELAHVRTPAHLWLARSR